MVLAPRRTDKPVLYHAAGLFLLTAAAALATLSTWIISRPALEITQMRGFIVALVLRLFMFLLAYRHISGRPFFGRQHLSGMNASV
jgi:hypothetical protein